MPAAIATLMLMVVGIPLAVLLLLVHVVTLFVGHASAGLAIGQRLVPGLSRYAAVAIGDALPACR
ncbi:MAG: hypothetical protein QN168_09165 [Armatimonadota bacterium]|nr:hypothetical protein [Armatimonadota bacterium]